MGTCESTHRKASSSGSTDHSLLVRKLNTAVNVVRVSTRVLDRRLVESQREMANMTEESSKCGSHVALPTATAACRSPPTCQPTVLGALPKTHRMSRVKTPDRKTIIEGILNASNKGHSPLGLEARLNSLGMQTKAMLGDGNCQFRAAAYNLFGSQSHHDVVRQAVVKHMKKHSDFFGIYFEDANEYRRYLQEMGRLRTWGDELTLRALVEAYCCEAHVVTSEASNWYLVYSSENDEDPDPEVALCPAGVPMPRKRKQIFLAYISPIHYNAIVSAIPLSNSASDPASPE